MINTNIYITDYIFIKYDKKNYNPNNKRIKESNKRTKNNPIRDIRGDYMEINQKVQRDLTYRDKNWLEDQYINQQKSSLYIANDCKVSTFTILRWLKKFDIERRTLSDATNIKFKNGFIHGMKDKNHSEESKKRLSETRKRKGVAKKERNPKWKGGIKKDKQGYIYILNRKHHHADKTGYVREHLLIIENYLKRQLWEWEIVHHINGIKNDNRIENLYLCKNRSHHRKIHFQIEVITMELLHSNKFGKIKFDKEKCKYYIEYQNE